MPDGTESDAAGRALVLIETSGNQRYIFATNKLAENVGASELLYRVGSTFVPEAIAESDGKYQGIIATSGKALVLADSVEAGRDLVTAVTTRCLEEAFGVTVGGVVVEGFDGGPVGAVQSAHRDVGRVTANQLLRHPTFPLLAPCSTSGQPSTHFDKKRGPQGAATRAKRDAAEAGRKRLLDVFAPGAVYTNLDELERLAEVEWLGLIHADGNGLGRVFLNFDVPAGERHAERYREELGAFSKAVEEVTQAAVKVAAENLRKRLNEGDRLPVVPLVLGGDDLTLLCDGKYALAFARDYLEAFEAKSAENDVISATVGRLAGRDRLSACAGVAVVKPHYPFHAAYELAEALLDNAKQVKRKVTDEHSEPLPCSAIDFHVLRDTAATDLAGVRRRYESVVASAESDQKAEKTVRLTAKPYLVTIPAATAEETPKWAEWVAVRTWDRLSSAVEAVKSLPSSLVHDLRSALMEGHNAADAEFRSRLRRASRDRSEVLKQLAGTVGSSDEAPSLFVGDGEAEVAYLLDALEISDLW